MKLDVYVFIPYNRFCFSLSPRTGPITLHERKVRAGLSVNMNVPYDLVSMHEPNVSYVHGPIYAIQRF